MRWTHLAIGVLALPLLAADAPFSPGRSVGEPAPHFELPGADGQNHALEALLAEERYLALLFFRSANW